MGEKLFFCKKFLAGPLPLPTAAAMKKANAKTSLRRPCKKATTVRKLEKTLGRCSVEEIALMGGSSVEFVGNPCTVLGCPRVGPERFDAMWKLCPAEPQYMTMWGKRVKLPRRQLCFGTNYRFSGEDHEPTPFPTEVDANGVAYDVQVRDFLAFAQTLAAHGVVCNQVLLNFYEDGKHYIGPHSDDEKQMDPRSSIFCFTLCEGEPRTFVVHSKCGTEKVLMPLLDGSMLIMRPGMQGTHKHSVPKRKGAGRRISITIRALFE